jgi:hypothetical protein
MREINGTVRIVILTLNALGFWTRDLFRTTRAYPRLCVLLLLVEKTRLKREAFLPFYAEAENWKTLIATVAEL